MHIRQRRRAASLIGELLGYGRFFHHPRRVDNMLAELFIPNGLDLDADEAAWVPQADGVWFRPLLLSQSQGYYLNLLRVRRAGVLSRHRHFGPVHAFTLRGSWRYLEHDWVASPGSYAFEVPGETHTLIVPEHVPEMITLFHVTAGYVYLDDVGVPTGYEDVFTKIAAARSHYRALGLSPNHIEQFLR
jgi:quercetin dioxygenase-like cupin family protein